MTEKEQELASIKKANALAGKDIESSGEEDDSDDGKPLFVNPLAAAKKAEEGKDSSEEWSDDDESDAKGKGKKDKKEKSILGKRKRKGDLDAV